MPGNPAPFVRKTFEIVNDNTTNHIVCWSPTGSSFLILQEHSFQKEILPKYFKHDNLCSFIRQLNTYGFRKVSGSKDFNTDHNVLEFEQPDFQKDHPELLTKLKRKTNKKPAKDEPLSPVSNEDINDIISDRAKMASALTTLIKQQQETEKTLKALWEELAEAKRVVADLESRKRRRSDTSPNSTPPPKRVKIELEEPKPGLPLAQVNPPESSASSQTPWLSSDNESESDVTSAARNMAELSSHMPFMRPPHPQTTS